MANKQFNSVDGFSIGNATVVIDANANFTATELYANGNISFTGSNVSLGSLSNIHIPGGSSGQVLTTDGFGNLSWTTVNGGSSGTLVISDVIVGDGTQTTYTLSVAPDNIDQTIVNYNGVTLLRDSYLIDGSNIIFGAAPALGAVIEVSIFSTGNAISGGSVSNGVVTTLANGNSNIAIPVANGTVRVSVNSVPDVLVISDAGIEVNGASDLGSNASVRIEGGSDGQALITDGAGNLRWGTIVSQVSDVSNGSSNVSIIQNGNITFSANGVSNVVSISDTTVVFRKTVDLGDAGNVIISGGNADQVLKTDGNGVLSWATLQPAGTNTSVQFNNNGIFGASGNLTFNDTTKTLSVDNISLSSFGSLIEGNLVSASYLAGTLTSAAQPNITSVGALTSLTVTGNIQSGNANLGNLSTANYVSGTLVTAAQPNITSVGTLSSLSVTGNVNAGNIIGIFANGTSSVKIPAAAGNILLSANGNANILVITGTGANVNGTLNVTGNLNGANIYATGDVYSSYSDVRLKKIVGPITNPIESLMKVDAFYYEPTEEAISKGASPGRKVGVSAQCMQDVLPEVVGKSALDGDYLTVQYDRMVPLLIEAIKEQQHQIKALTKKVANLTKKCK